jgi:hypothetical protein
MCAPTLPTLGGRIERLKNSEIDELTNGTADCRVACIN